MIYKHIVATAEMSGAIEIDLLPWKERMSKSKELLYKLENEKLVDRDDIERYELAIDFAISRIKSVDVETKEKNKIDSVELLMMYKEGTKIVNEISSIIINGVSLEKK